MPRHRFQCSMERLQLGMKNTHLGGDGSSHDSVLPRAQNEAMPEIGEPQ